MKQNKRMIEKAARKVDRERQKLELQDKKTVNEIKKLAKKGQHKAAAPLAKHLVQIRN